MQSSFMQSNWWAEFKRTYGWQTHQAFGLSVLENPAKFKRTFLYIPEVETNSDRLPAITAQAISALHQFKNSRTIFGRVEFLVPFSDSNAQKLKTFGLVKAKDEVQPEHRQEIDLTLSAPDLLTQMKPKGRYNINVARKHEVEVFETNKPEDINAFIQLNYATTKRKNIQGRNGEYLTRLIKILNENNAGGLWVAKHQNQILSGAIIVIFQGKASYLYGASSDQNRNTMSPYLLHFTIMQHAKTLGCKVYDMIGVAPVDAPANHPWHGISRFKREFGGTTEKYLGSFDKIYQPAWYKIYQLGRKK